MPQQIINGVGKAGIRVVPVQSAYDTDAQAFITATALTNDTQKNAVNDLVLDLKGAGIWTKMKALYPLVGGTAAAHKFNLKDPRDLNAAFRLQFNGGWTHDSNGAQPSSALNGYANTFLTPTTSLTLNNVHLSVYSRDNSATGDIGCYNNTPYPTLALFDTTRFTCYDGMNASDSPLSSPRPSSIGFYIGTRTSATSSKLFVNTVLYANAATSTGTQPSVPMYLGAINGYNYTLTNKSSKRYSFFSIGDGLTDLESTIFYQIVEKYQFALGRNVNASRSFYYNRNYDLNTNLFFINAGITDATQISATGTLVNTLKTAGIWTKMKAVYPFVGGTATSHKFNLVNPINSTSAFALTFNGGGTHDSNGYQTNASNALADTNLTPSVTLALNSTHISIYSRTNSVGNYSDLATQDASSRTVTISSRWTGDVIVSRINEGFSPSVGTNTDSRGFYIGSRTASNVRKTYKNNSLFNTDSTASTGLATTKIGLGANYYNNSVASSNYFSNRQYAFASIGDGLTDAEATTFYNAVQAFQTTLGRQV